MIDSGSRKLAITFAILLVVALIATVADADGMNRRGVRAAVCEVFGARCGLALRVASCETGGTLDARAQGSAGERGIFQIHPTHFGWIDERRLWHPAYNAWIAYRLSRGGRDWSHWTCRP
jgi:Lysozyme like domain